jgi:hypothetical protein
VFLRAEIDIAATTLIFLIKAGMGGALGRSESTRGIVPRKNPIYYRKDGQ